MNGGKTIRELRIQLGLSLKQLAEKARVHYVFLSRLESGLEKPSEDLIKRLAKEVEYKGNIEELIASFGKIPTTIEKLILDDPSAVVELPAFFKSRRKKRRDK